MTNEEEKILHEFIWESNAIEGVKSEEAFNDSLSAWRYIEKLIETNVLVQGGLILSVIVEALTTFRFFN